MTTATLTDGILAELQLLTREEAAGVVEALFEERQHWTPRHSDYPIFTMGRASYLDGPKLGFAAFQEEALKLNPILHARFGWLHERLRQAVSTVVGSEARFDERLALPGFHIYLSDPAKVQPVASVHFDMQFEKIDWSSIGAVDRDQQLSLTVAIDLPASGGGLLVWNVNRLEIEKMTPEVRREHMAANRNAAYHAYTVGNLVVHSGHQLHQIAKTKDVQATDRRITMQSHASPVNGEWVIYW
jgi:hypothetical protein